MRKILEERLANAKLDYRVYPVLSSNDIILGQIKAYQDCLNLLDKHTPKIFVKPITDEELQKALKEKLYVPNQVIIERNPAPRTEQEILKDFEALGWKVVVNNENEIELHRNAKNNILVVLNILKSAGEYTKYMIMNGKTFFREIKFQEHKLLNELFEVWQWI